VSQNAIEVAISLLRQPSRVRFVRSEPLPDGLLDLLLIAAGDEEAESRAAVLMNRSREDVRRAANFFVEQVLLHSGADTYRVLGAHSSATANELRRNMGLLMRWLHHDPNRGNERGVFVARVTTAWNDVKTPERRSAYDTSHPRIDSKINRTSSRTRLRFGSPQNGRQRSRKRSLAPHKRGMTVLRRALLFFFART